MSLVGSAVGWWDARAYSGSGNLTNQGTGGSALDLVMPGGANNPTWLPGPTTTDQYLAQTSGTGNYASAPFTTVTGLLDVVMRLAPNSWSDGNYNSYFGHRQSQGGLLAWEIYRSMGTKRLVLDRSADGGSWATSATATADVPFADGVAGWVRVTHDPAAGTVNFYTAADQATEPATWTQLGATVSVAAMTPYVSAAPLVTMGGFAWGGKFYRGIVRSAGTVVADFDASRGSVGSSTFVASSGETWTMNGATAIARPNFAYFPGVALAYASTPDSAIYNTTDIDIMARVNLTTWSAANQCFIAKDNAAADRSFIFYSTGGALAMSIWNQAGAVLVQSSSSVGHGFTDGTTHWVRATVKLNNGAGGNDLKFYTAPDSPAIPTTWTQLGSTITNAVTGTSVFDSVIVPCIGSRAGAGDMPMTGSIYRLLLSGTIGGAPLIDFDPSRSVQPHGVFTAITGEQWTWQRPASGKKLAVVDRPMFLFGGNSYLSINANAFLDFAHGDSFTVVAAARIYGAASANQNFILKDSGHGTRGYRLWRWNGTSDIYFQANDGGVDGQGHQVAGALGYFTVLSGTRSLDAGTISAGWGASVQPAVDTTTGTFASGATFVVGSSQGAGEPSEMEFVGAAVFRHALSTAELNQIITEMTSVGLPALGNGLVVSATVVPQLPIVAQVKV